MALNIIDFSKGIRPEEIQENFEYLQTQLSRERLSVGGSGIASGLEVSFNITDINFDVKVSDGVIIDKYGEEIFVTGNTFTVDLPDIEPFEEYCTLDADRMVKLKHVPYGLNRRRPSEFLKSYVPEVSGIKIRYRDSIKKDDYIRVRDIKETTLSITGALRKDIVVNYYYSGNRIDILYVDDNFEVRHEKLSKGTTSSTPSVPTLPPDAKFLIAFIEVASEYIDENDPVPHAWMYIKNDLRSMRNLYTDSDGTLYICNMAFDDLQIIHLKEPEHPKPNTLWLNLMDNTLYCWRNTDEFVYKNSLTITTDFLKNINTADITFSTDMSFTIGKHELTVYKNRERLVLGRDYEEIGLNLPTLTGNEGIEEERGNLFQILQSDDDPDILKPGDVITYVLRYKDSEYIWVPVNKSNYVNAKDTKVYCTYYLGIDDNYLVLDDEETRTKKAYFDCKMADMMGLDPVTNYPYKYQYFIFHKTDDLNMHFTPDRNELSIMINQMYLHEDQFREITVYDLLEETLPRPVLDTAAVKLGWTKDYLETTFNKESGNMYDNTGIGFMLMEPLDAGAKADGDAYSNYADRYGSNDLFVEAIVERRVNTAPFKNKLQRSATFILEDTIKLDADRAKSKIIELPDIKYKYDEHQLEVFINGVKQIEGIDYIEEFGDINYFKEDGSIDEKYAPIDENEKPLDKDYFIRKKAAVCTKFKFLDHKVLSEDMLITYKITTNVYSYDHINSILDDIGTTLTSCKEIVETNRTLVSDLEKSINDRLEAMEIEIQEAINVTGQYMTWEVFRDTVLATDQMPDWIIDNTIKSLNHINTELKLDLTMVEDDKIVPVREYDLIGIFIEDYVNVVHGKCVDDENKIYEYWPLINGIHYEIKKLTQDKTVIRLKDEFVFSSKEGNDCLYFSGLKLSLEGHGTPETR